MPFFMTLVAMLALSPGAFAGSHMFNDFDITLSPPSPSLTSAITQTFPIPLGAGLELRLPFGDVTVEEVTKENYVYPSDGKAERPLVTLEAKYTGTVPTTLSVKYLEPRVGALHQPNPPVEVSVSRLLAHRGDTEAPGTSEGLLGNENHLSGDALGVVSGARAAVPTSRGTLLQDNPTAHKAPGLRQSPLKLTLKVPSRLLRSLFVVVDEGGSFVFKGLRPSDANHLSEIKTLSVFLYGKAQGVKIENFIGSRLYLYTRGGYQVLKNIFLSSELMSSLDGSQKAPVQAHSAPVPDLEKMDQVEVDNTYMENISAKSIDVRNTLGTLLVKKSCAKKFAFYYALKGVAVKH